MQSWTGLIALALWLPRASSTSPTSRFRPPIPSSRRSSARYSAETRRVIPGATWCAAGIGRVQNQVMNWALARGADGVRTGMEDNIRISKDRLASGNAELVQVAVKTLTRHGARPATPAEAPRGPGHSGMALRNFADQRRSFLLGESVKSTH